MTVRAAIVVAGLVAWFAGAMYVTNRAGTQLGIQTKRVDAVTTNVRWGQFVGLEGLNR